MKLLCIFRLYLYGAWYLSEVPIWCDNTGTTAVGNQPVKQQLYGTPGGGTMLKYEPDTSYRLIGKITEQRRTCVREGCHYTQVRLKKWKV